MASPLKQFLIKPIIDIEVYGIDLSITNSVLMMFIATSLIIFLFSFVNEENHKVPSRMQIICESFYNLIANMIEENTGKDGRPFIPFVITIFLFILFCNLIGMAPYSFTATSQLAVTFFISIMVFLVIIVTGFVKQGLGFLKIFAPEGLPIWLAPLIILIELFAFLARPISLCLRLTANMIAGHVLLKVLAGFVVTLPLFAKIIPLPFITILIGFEIFIAILQAYIFAILSCVYLSDAINGH